MKLKVKNISVNIGFYFAAVLALLLSLDKTNISFYSFFSAILHEAGHLTALLFLKANPREISFGIFGMRIIRGSRNLSYIRELITALSGPAVNLILSGLFLFTDELIFSAVNLAIGSFNLLPVRPMDGGEALYFFLCRFCQEGRIQKITDIITGITVLFLFFAGIWVLIKSGYNFMLLAVSAYIVIYRLFMS